jgi:peptide subunit release factor 1 (eRF1)
LLADTNSARLLVFGLGKRLDEQQVINPKTNRTSVGGWSQARYQRHNENYHLHHAKEVVEALDRIVREEGIERIVLSGDEVIMPTLHEQLPPHLAEKVIDILHLDIKTPEHEVLQATLEAMRERDAKDDAEKVNRMLGEWRAGGLAVVGAHDTLAALEIGQVDELLISASRDAILLTDEQQRAGAETTQVADELVTKAHQTSARVTFIENADLLAGVGGVGALLRYRL